MKYFTLRELTSSATAKRLGINNTPSPEVKRNLEALVENVLDPLREAWGAPIIVTSGYRCVKLNNAVGGAKSSQHTTGQAADIRTVADTVGENKKLRDLIVSLGLTFDQLIDEYGSDWIHVSFKADGKNRGQLLSAVKYGRKTVYKAGFNS